MSSGPSNSVESPEPDPFNEDELRAWRGFRRTRTTVENELTRRLQKSHDLTILQYGVLITLLSAPGRRLRMTDLAEQVLTSLSGMTRAIVRLRDEGLVEREQDPDDLRSFVVSLKPEGLGRLRETQVTHHACVRELLFDNLDDEDIQRLATIYDRAMPGVLDAPTWPAPTPEHSS